MPNREVGSKVHVGDRILEVLALIVDRLERRDISWAVTGSCGMALQGVPICVNDIDLQTDSAGAYCIERCLAEYRCQPVAYVEAERIRSHFGVLLINDLKVEIMGDVQKRWDTGTWESSVDVNHHKRWVTIDSLQIPVLALDYECEAYHRLGRHDKAEFLRQWLHKRAGDSENPAEREDSRKEEAL